MWKSTNYTAIYWMPKILYIRIIRRKNVMLLILLLASFLAALPAGWWLADVVSRVLLPPSPPYRDLRHFLRTRSLPDYLNNIHILIEPNTSPCAAHYSVPVLILVFSPPEHYEHREAIRNTWAKYQPTLFIMGLHRRSSEAFLGDNYIEGKQFMDLLVFDFYDNYQNLTLKTALMLQWVSTKCPQVNFLFKTDEDVLVNPWILQNVMRDHSHAQLIGYSINNTKLHRDEYNKYYVPRWLCPDDLVPQYLSGTGYLINGAYIRMILYTSFHVPLVNVEDVYITYMVAKKSLNLTLTHDRRLSPKRPWIATACLYWNLASAHSMRPAEIMKIWPSLKLIARDYNRRYTVCYGYDFFNKDLFMY